VFSSIELVSYKIIKISVMEMVFNGFCWLRIGTDFGLFKYGSKSEGFIG
jgi:hypothetical protein